MSYVPERMQTRFTELLGIRYPIVQGGLAHLSLAPLAAAVSNAGGLGQIGAACFATPEELQASIREAKGLTAQPFGVNFPLGLSINEQFLDVALAEEPAAISITGGNPEAFLRRIQQSGVASKTLVLVAGVRAAQKAEALGADAVIAVGFEGGGHLGRDDIGTIVLTPRIVDAVRIPVLASGGIVDGRGLAAALALGATGVELGTRFVAVQESNAHPSYKQAIVEAKESDTVIIERSIGRPARVLNGLFVKEILQVEQQGEPVAAEERVQRLLPYIRGSVNKRAALEGALEEGFVWGGQAVGLIHDIPTVQVMIERMVSEAQAIVQSMNNLF
jgi:NAD(P)H-dependent flavin oxidoreductase YrpB (nitropropane dioxygenase family)